MADPPESTDDDVPEKKVAEMIMEYLAQHPHAMDTAEGVSAWWLGGDSAHTDLATTRRALERLAASGILLKIGEGERAHYRLPRDPRPH